MSIPSYCILNTETFQRLNQLNAPKSVLQVIIALNAYAMSHNSCFPSLKTIKEYIGTNMGLNTISVALKWLRENRFIEQNHRSSKERFVLTYRRAVKAAKGVLSQLRQEKSKVLSGERQRREPSYVNNKWKHKRRKSSKKRVSHAEIQRRQQQALKEQENRENNAEIVMGWVIMGQDPLQLPEHSKLAILRGFSNPAGALRKWSRETGQEDFILGVLNKLKPAFDDVVRTN